MEHGTKDKTEIVTTDASTTVSKAVEFSDEATGKRHGWLSGLKRWVRGKKLEA